MTQKMKWNIIGLVLVSMMTGVVVGVLCAVVRFDIPGPQWLLWLSLGLCPFGIYSFARSIRLQMWDVG